MMSIVFGVFSFKIFTVLIGFFGTLVLTRLLGAEKIGEYFWLLSCVAICTVFIKLGQENIIVKQIGALKSDNKNTLAASIVFNALKRSLFFSFILLIIGFIAFKLFESSMSGYLVLIYTLFLCASLSVFISLLSYGLQGMNFQMMQAVLNSLPRLIVVFVALTYLICNFELNLATLFNILSISYLSTALFALIVYKNKKIPIFKIKQRQAADFRSSDSLNQFYWVSIIAVLVTEAANLVLGFLSTSEQVAYFSISARLVSIVSLILIAFNSVLSPRFAQFYSQNNNQELISLFQRTRLWGLGVSIPILVILFCFSEEILVLFGSDFKGATNVLRVLLIAHVFKVFVGSVGQLLLMTGHVYYQRVSLVSAAAVLIILCIILCPLYGALGAAIATLVAVMCNNLMGLYFVNKKLNIPYFFKTKVFTSHA